ncbi:hypothetical protein A5708_03865 [Mycobacterium colombiense]|uniref:DUF732 domain-containing protein n=1 Tax=Mycobacterium colombiense TaxID=339268 RepID=A0A1A2YPL4_9MYCO|nr:hypothetical protein A5708_03865 [Mycobacterium colombiense]
MVGPVAVAVAGLISIAVAPMASADPADDQYLHTLQQHGIGWPNGSEQAMINVGHAVCQDWAGGDTLAQTVGDVQKTLGLSNNGSGTIVGAATAAYCPEFRSKIP